MANMTFFFSIISTSLFAVVFLWVIAAWLKADEETEAVEQAVQTTLEALKRADCLQPSAGCCVEYDRLVVAGSRAA